LIDRRLLQVIVEMLSSLGNLATDNSKSVYSEVFELPFLNETKKYYAEESIRFLDSNDVPQYLKLVQRRFDEEKERIRHYLRSSTRKPLIEAAEMALLSAQSRIILGETKFGLGQLLNMESRLVDVRLLFKLFRRLSNGIEDFSAALYNYVRTAGLSINEQAELPEEGKRPFVFWVEQSHKLKMKFDLLYEQAFESVPMVETKLNEAFESFINNNPRSPEDLSLYIDMHLVKKSKKVFILFL
jgi:cullin 3